MSTSNISNLNDPALQKFALALVERILNIGKVQKYILPAYITFRAEKSQQKAKAIASVRIFPSKIRFHAHNIDKNGMLDIEDPYPFIEIIDTRQNVDEIMAIVERSYARLTGK